MIYTNDNIHKKILKKKRNSKIFSLFVYFIVLPLIILNGINLLKYTLDSKYDAKLFGFKTYIVSSGSMIPKLNIGDVILLNKNKKNEYDIGDIISFTEGQSTITHRIVRKEYDDKKHEIKYITKGDNNNAEDTNPVYINQIQGYYLTKIPLIGNLVWLLQKPIFVIFLFIIILTTFITDIKYDQILKNRHKKRIEYEKNKEKANKGKI